MGDEPTAPSISPAAGARCPGTVGYSAPMFVVPIPLTPVASTLARPPFHRAGWVYEEKVDGWRLLAYKDGTRVRH